MNNCKLHYGLLVGVCFIIFFVPKEISAKSVKIRTKSKSHVTTPEIINYPKVKERRPTRPLSDVMPHSKNDLVRVDSQDTHVHEPSADIIQTRFDSGIQQVIRFLQGFTSRTDEDNPNETESTKFRIPGLPSSHLVHHLNVSSIVKLLEATDGAEAQTLAETAVIDLASQLIKIIGFNDLREWLGIILMYFILGPIMIPLFWLPISLFGMVGLLAPLFFFNPPSKPNVDVMGHDPILPVVEGAGEKRSQENLTANILKFLSFPRTIFMKTSKSTTEILESCVERVSCHLTKMYRDNPISSWLTSHFNATKVEWARVHPADDINENGISSWEDCKKYSCTLFPAA